MKRSGEFTESDCWASPTVFVPRTLWRTWGTRRFPPSLPGTPEGGGSACESIVVVVTAVAQMKL